MKETNIDAWLQSGEYLPVIMRDFHAQKKLFRAMHEIVENNPDDIVKRPSWIEGHCYVVDVFLYFMGRRGYTLQRTKRHGHIRPPATRPVRAVAINECHLSLRERTSFRGMKDDAAIYLTRPKVRHLSRQRTHPKCKRGCVWRSSLTLRVSPRTQCPLLDTRT